MSEDFQKNFVGTSDPSFVYDKQVDFGDATEDNDWDDE